MNYQSWITLCCLLWLMPAYGQEETPTHTQRETWHDTQRDLQLPVKIIYPHHTEAPAPVILISHGLGGTRESMAYLGQALAEQGYIVIHMQHPASDDHFWKDLPPARRLAAFRRVARDPRAALQRPEDVQFCLNYLEQLNDTHPLADRVDLQRVAIVGHSFGAWTAMTQAGQQYVGRRGRVYNFRDERIDAVIALSPAPPDERHRDTAYNNIQTPVMHMTGTLDTTPITQASAQDRQLPFQLTPSTAPDQYLIVFEGGDHMIFSGQRQGNLGQTPPEMDAIFEQHITHASLLFLDTYLHDNEQARQALQQGILEETLSQHATFDFQPQQAQ